MGTGDRPGAGGTSGEPPRQDEKPGSEPHRGATSLPPKTLERLALLERRIEELRRTRAERDAARSELLRLAANEARYRALVETCPDCVWEVDSRGRSTYVRPRFRGLAGFSPPAFIGRSPVDLVEPDQAAGFREQLRCRLAACQP